MNPQELQTLLDGVKDEIKVTVNGKIDNLTKMLDNHIAEHDKLTEKLDPLVDAVRWINTSRKFVVWIGVPIATIGTMVATIKGWAK